MISSSVGNGPLLAVIGVLSIILFGAVGVSAHGPGLSLSATTTPYAIDIGYDPNEFQVGSSARFDFRLLHESNSEIASYDHVWVRLQSENNTVLATGIRHQKIGPTALLYSFLEPGSYRIETSFRDVDGNDIAVSSFPISISPGGSDGSMVPSALMFLSGVCVGVFGFFIWSRRI